MLLEPLQTAGSLRSTVVTRFTATMGPAETLSPSTNFPVFPVIWLPCSADFSTGRGGFLQLLSMPLSPCCPSHPAEASRRVSQLRRSVLSSPLHRGLDLRICRFRGHLWVYFRYGPVTCSHPKDGFVNRFQKFSFFPSCYSSYGASDSYPGGTTSR